MKDFKITRRLMGSLFELIIADDDQERAGHYLDVGINEIVRLEKLLTEFSDTSETSQVNRNAGISPTRVSTETYRLVQRCVQLSKLTQGAFDITVGPLKSLYNFKNGNGAIPNDENIKNVLGQTGYENIYFLDNNHLYLAKTSMKIGFSAIGKGYAADSVKKIWLEAGVQNAVVNASGDLTVIGKNANGQPWQIGIADPDQPDKVLFYLPLNNGSVATSGNYEQFFMQDGVRYGHTINPKTGLPVTGIQSVTVLGPGGELCDALATAVYVMGIEVGMHLIHQLPGTHCLIIDDKNQLHQSENLNFEYAEN
jgi:FAD:protein FMN transferase